MVKRMRFGVLAATHGIMDAYVIDALFAAGVTIDALILDQKPLLPKDLNVHLKRTGDRLPLRSVAEAAGGRVQLHEVENHNDGRTQALVRALALDWLINVGTPRILKPELLGSPTQGVVNCHPGLLPAFRGSSAVEWAIYLDEPVGNTVHLM